MNDDNQIMIIRQARLKYLRLSQETVINELIKQGLKRKQIKLVPGKILVTANSMIDQAMFCRACILLNIPHPDKGRIPEDPVGEALVMLGMQLGTVEPPF